MATPIPLQGTVITYQNAALAAQTVGGMDTISGLGGGSASTEIVSTFASTAVEKRSGLVDNGSFTLSGFYDRSDAGQAAMYTALESSALREMVVTKSNSEIGTFDALITSVSQDGSTDESWKVSVTVEISGDITWT